MELKAALKDIKVDRMRHTNTFTKNIFGRLATATRPGLYTSNVCMELETGFLAVRIGVPNVSASEQAGVKVCVAPTSENNLNASWMNNVNPVNGAWTNATFGGQSSVTLAPRVAEEQWSITWSDPIYIQDVPRTDNGTRPLLMVRIEFASGATVSVPQSGTYYWRTTTSGRLMKGSVQEVSGVSDRSTFTTTATTDTDAVVPVVQYVGKRSGHQMFISGDSIQMGLGGTVRDNGAIQRVVMQNSIPSAPIDYFNAALHAQTSTVYSGMAVAHLDAVKPTMMTYAPYTINEVPVGGMRADTKATMLGNLSKILTKVDSMALRPRIFLMEGLPCNTAYKNTGANDVLRVNLNAEIATFSGATVIKGYAAAVTGAADANGQLQIKDGISGDGVHYNDSGYDLLAGAVSPYVLNVI